jgi:hypothetical protein
LSSKTAQGIAEPVWPSHDATRFDDMPRSSIAYAQ